MAEPSPADLAEPTLADTTVWSKCQPDPDLARWFNQQVRSGMVLVCDVVVLELLRSARSPAAYDEQAAMLDLLEPVPTTAQVLERSRQVQQQLATRSQHRGVPPADLLIAATAELAGVPLLHYDHDYDVIASTTEQVCHWLAPRGTLA